VRCNLLARHCKHGFRLDPLSFSQVQPVIVPRCSMRPRKLSTMYSGPRLSCVREADHSAEPHYQELRRLLGLFSFAGPCFALCFNAFFKVRGRLCFANKSANDPSASCCKLLPLSRERREVRGHYLNVIPSPCL
jgi:hypothetical protein